MRYHIPLSASLLVLSLLAVLSPRAAGIILLGTADPNANTSTPGDNSGWQYEGQFNGFLGTPIGPRYFITANHIGGTVGDVFHFHGEVFTTTALFVESGPGATDLKIWQVDHDFATWAPLYTGNSEPGQEVRVFGCGTQRGDAMVLDGQLKGWKWGPGDGRQRWGRNTVSGTTTSYYDIFMYSNFDSPGLVNEAHLSAGDSGGGEFILDHGLWKLAATNYGVDDLYAAADDGTEFVASVFDGRGYYSKDDNGAFYLIDGTQNVPTAFYGTRVSPKLEWIKSVIGGDPGVLSAETFGSWLHGYFTPAELADSTATGPGSDPDRDSVTNLQEYAFNLDPAFAEVVVMTAGTGLRGLPLVRLEPVATTGDTRLTVEFVRRTAASGSGLAYTVQFTDDLAAGNWQASGTEATTSINTRWDRVKVTDGVAVGGSVTRRFARVVVTSN